MLAISALYPTKKAFVTGAASGLGKAFCTELAKDGWTIVMTDHNLTALAEAKEEIMATGATVYSYELDVTNRLQYAHLVHTVWQQTGGIDLLINNAGVGDGGDMGDYALDNWDWMIDINLKGVIHGCHFFVPYFKQQKAGVIINVASLAAVSSPPGMGAYNATKAAVVAISETLYSELGIYNIKVGCLMPGFFKTNVVSNARGSDEVKKIAGFLMNRADFTAADVAFETLQKTVKGKLYILIPREARKLFLFKRLMPMRFRKMVTEKWDLVKRIVQRKQME